jgi:hypothetical protein
VRPLLVILSGDVDKPGRYHYNRRRWPRYTLRQVHLEPEEMINVAEGRPAHKRTPIRPMTDEDDQRGREALAASKTRIARLRTLRHGVPLTPSWPLIREAREEREQQV